MRTLEQNLYRELVLDKRLHEIWEETYETDDLDELSELKKERLEVQLELGELRLDLYLKGRESNKKEPYEY